MIPTSKAYRTPRGSLYRLFDEMAAQPHLLVAGATGSGKSVLVSGILYNLLHNAPSESDLILLDPKRTELRRYADLPHTITYADTVPAMVQALEKACAITERRFQTMQKRGEMLYSGGDVYVVIDELAALMTAQKNAVLPLLQHLGMVARAARVHMIACTQTVNASVLPTTLTCNFDSRVALRTATAQQSRMLIQRAGCENFPSPSREGKAFCFFRTGADITLHQIPRYSDSDYSVLLTWWRSKQCIA